MKERRRQSLDLSFKREKNDFHFRSSFAVSLSVSRVSLSLASRRPLASLCLTHVAPKCERQFIMVMAMTREHTCRHPQRERRRGGRLDCSYRRRSGRATLSLHSVSLAFRLQNRRRKCIDYVRRPLLPQTKDLRLVCLTRTQHEQQQQHSLPLPIPSHYACRSLMLVSLASLLLQPSPANDALISNVSVEKAHPRRRWSRQAGNACQRKLMHTFFAHFLAGIFALT